jgi:hypothetical protein
MNYSNSKPQDDHTASVCTYLTGRGLSPENQYALHIRWVSYDEAIALNFGREATSPNGLILFPSAEGTPEISRNWYPNPEVNIPDHLELINQKREKQGLKPATKTAKYLVPVGSSSRLYDPSLVLHPGSDTPILFATEDVIGVARAAIAGVRIASTFGVWLAKNEELERSQQEGDWRHELRGKFPAFLADSDAIEKHSVFRSLVRTGFVVGCNVGYFPSLDRSKNSLDDWLNTCNPERLAEDLNALVAANSQDAIALLDSVLPNVDAILQERGFNRTESMKISTPLREQATAELLLHQSIDGLRASGFYGEVLKPLGVNLAALREAAKKKDGGSDSDRGAMATIIIDLVKAETCLWHDSEQAAYADIVIDGARHSYPLQSSGFKRWVSMRIYQEYEKAPNNEAYQAARNTLESQAQFNGIEQKPWLRTASHDGKLYLDLANDQWQSVEISATGWTVVDHPPVRFIRPSSMLPIPTPVRGGNVDMLR